MNWILEDFYAGKVAIYHAQNGRSKELDKILKWNKVGGMFDYYYWDTSNNEHDGCDNTCDLPSAPLSYFISLLDAQEKQPEYIYEPFSEEAAKGGAVVTWDTDIVEWCACGKDDESCIKENGILKITENKNLSIRRTVETKEVECYVYEDGHISSWNDIGHSKIIDTFTHTIKISKK